MTVRRVLTVLVLCALTVGVVPGFTVEVAAQGGWECGAYDQTRKRGRTPVADAEGRVFPVVTIHGITGSDEDFDKTIDKSYIEANPQPPRSLLDAFAGSKTGEALPPGLEGVQVYSFSYTPDSLRWLDNPSVGPKFAETIDCLYAKFGVPVSVVAHSMGGLVARWVANTSDSDGKSRATKLGKVVTLGTPYEGSEMSAVANGAAEAAGEASPWVALLNYLCGAQGTASGNGACGPIPLYASFRSEAGRNLQAGSEAIKKLARWPAGVDVSTIAGSQRVPFELFGSPLNTSVDLGDLAVGTASATADPSAGRVFECNYDSATGTYLTEWKEIFRVASPQDRQAQLGRAFLASPCYHSNLMRNVELTNEILGQLSDWLETRRATSIDLQQVAAGNYASLTGTWTEVANSSNPKNGTGMQWEYGGPHTISISSDAIIFNDLVTLRGSTLDTDSGNGPESHPLSFQNRGGYLQASLVDENAPTNWELAFYPKGSVDLDSELQPNNGVTLDNSRNTITLWVSNNGSHSVFSQTG